MAEITDLGLAVYLIFSVLICNWFSELALKVYVVVKGLKFSNIKYDPYTGQLIKKGQHSGRSDLGLVDCHLMFQRMYEQKNRWNLPSLQIEGRPAKV